MSTQDLAALVKRLEAVANKLEKVGGSTQKTTEVESGEQVKAYDDYYTASVTPFIDLTKQIGADLTGVVPLIEKAFGELRKVIDIASKSKKPSDQDFANLLKPINAALKETGDYCFKHNRGAYQNHLRGLEDGLKLLQWVAVPNTPVPYIKDMVEAARFYHIKVLVEYKKKEEEVAKLHKNWVDAWATVGNDLAAYVKEHHTTGLKWNPNGGVSSNVSTTEVTKKPEVKKNQATVLGGKGPAPKVNLFAELNKGGQITSGLKHVKKEEKTKYQTGPKTKVGFQTKAKAVKRITGNPVLELKGEQKWVVENHDGNKKLEINADSIKQTAYIFKCDNSNIIVKGKLNSITIDNCVKTNLIFDDLVSSCDVVNCKSVKVQVLGAVPTIIVDKTDGINVFLNEKTLHTTFVSSKSSEMNISVPEGKDDFKEFPVPEQYVTTYKDGKFQTNTSSHV